MYAPETDDEKAIFDVVTSRLGSVASGDDEVLHAAIANDFADCVLDYTGESTASFGLDADAYADWAMRSLVYEVDWVYVDDEADEATVYYYANSYRSYDGSVLRHRGWSRRARGSFERMRECRNGL